MTSEMPELIWLWRDQPHGNLVMSTPSQPYPKGSPQYIRADLHQQALDAAREEGRRVGLEEGFAIAAKGLRDQIPTTSNAQTDWSAGWNEAIGCMVDIVGSIFPNPADPVAEAAMVLLGDDYESPILEALDPFSNDIETHKDVLSALRVLAQKEGE